MIMMRGIGDPEIFRKRIVRFSPPICKKIWVAR